MQVKHFCAAVLLMLIYCWLLLPLWGSVFVSCFVEHCFVSFLVLQSSWWRREGWLLYVVCLCWSAVCDCGISWSYSLALLSILPVISGRIVLSELLLTITHIHIILATNGSTTNGHKIAPSQKLKCRACPYPEGRQGGPDPALLKNYLNITEIYISKQYWSRSPEKN